MCWSGYNAVFIVNKRRVDEGEVCGDNVKELREESRMVDDIDREKVRCTIALSSSDVCTFRY